MQEDRASWETYLRTIGYPAAQPIAAGMEGVVYRLGEGRVAKVWAARSTTDLDRLQRFYQDLSSCGLSVATPEIWEIHHLAQHTVTIERELPGRPLSDYIAETDATVPLAAIEALSSVLATLARTTAPASARNLSVLGEGPAWHEDTRWSDALAELTRRRALRFGGQLRNYIADFEDKLTELLSRLRALEPLVKLVHGDLVPANILVDGSLRPVAVVDFGFLSTAGDPAFDAAIAASVFNMYGPHARSIDDLLTTNISQVFGYSRERLILYKAAYAVITSNSYDPAGQDGHFRWCVQMLRREDVAAALLSP